MKNQPTTLRAALEEKLANSFFETVQFDLMCLTSFAKAMADTKGLTMQETQNTIMEELKNKDTAAQMRQQLEEHKQLVIQHFKEKAA